MLGLALIAAIATAVAITVTVTTHRFQLSQLDDRLATFAGPSHTDYDKELPEGFEGETPDADDTPLPTIPNPSDWFGDRPSDVFRGLLYRDGTYRVVFTPTTYTVDELSNLQFDATQLSTTEPTFVTIESTTDTHYRAIAVPRANGWEITALSLADVEEATARLVMIEAAGIGALIAGLALVGWWVISLGVTPMRRLVDASSKIADGDLDVRLDNVGGGKEAAELGHSLNTMVSRLTGALAERERSERRLREFVADASHELRTPLTTVLGYAQLFRVGALGRRAEQADAWGRTEAEAGRMKRLVEDMLELARYDAEPQLNLTATPVNAMVAQIVAEAGRAHPEVSFTVAPESASVETWVDADRLRQAIINVVSNAAQHGASEVTVTLALDTELGAAGDAPSAKPAAVIEISDNGPGMPPEVAERATERFVRGDSSRSRATGGAGLGLAITAAIVQVHGGTLEIASTEGVGTKVTLRLPTP